MSNRTTFADVWRHARGDRARMVRLLCLLACLLVNFLAGVAVIAAGIAVVVSSA